MDYQVRFLKIESTIIESLLDVQNTLSSFNPTSQKTASVAISSLTNKPIGIEPPIERIKSMATRHEFRHLTFLQKVALEDLASIQTFKEIAKKIEIEVEGKPIADVLTKISCLRDYREKITTQKLKLGMKQNALLAETHKLRNDLQTFLKEIQVMNPELYRDISPRIGKIHLSLNLLEFSNIPNPQNLSGLSGQEIYYMLKKNTIHDLDMLSLLLKKIAIKDPELLLKILPEFSLKHERVYDVAFCLARQKIDYLKQFIAIFKIKDAESLSLLALGCVIINPAETIQNIEIFKIEDPNVLLQVGKTCCDKDPKHAPSYLYRLPLTPYENYQSLQILAQRNPTSVASHIDKYVLPSETFRIQIALMIAVYSGAIVAEALPKFKICDPKAQYTIAMKCAQNDGNAVARFFHHFHAIHKETEQAEIAKAAAKENGGGLSEHIANFKNIKELSLLEDILFTAAKSSGRGTARHIQNYIHLGLNDPSLLFKAARLCLSQDPTGASHYFQRFGIKDPESRYKLALMGAKKDGFAIASYFHNFKLTNPEHILEVAKCCARQNGFGFAAKLGNFGIKNQAQLVTLAKIAARQNPGGLSSLIHLFGIKTEDERLEIALLAATHENSSTHELTSPRFIENYALQHEENRAQVALSLSRTCGKKLLEYLDRFKLSKSPILTEIILSALTSFWITLLSKTTYDERDWEISNYMVVMKYSKGLLEYLTQFSTLPQLEGESGEEKSHRIYQNLTFLMKTDLQLKSYEIMVFDQLYLKTKHLLEKQRLLYWMIPLMMIMKARVEVKNLLSERYFVRILGIVADCALPNLRGELTAILVSMCASDKLLSVWLLLEDSQKRNAKNGGDELPTQTQLASIALAPLACLSEELRIKCQDLLSIVQSERSHFRSQRHLKDFLELMFLLKKSSHEQLQASDILNLLTVIHSAKSHLVELSKAVCTVKDIIRFGHAERCIQVKDLPSLNSTMKEIFHEEFDIVGVENFDVKYHKTFGSFRNNEAVLTYANKLRSISSHETVLFNEYVQTVLDESFHETRYQLEKNPHLRFLDHMSPGLLSIWCKGEKMSAINLIEQENFEPSPRINPEKYLKLFIVEKIGHEQHLTKELKTAYPNLAQAISIIESANCQGMQKEGLEKIAEKIKLQLDGLKTRGPLGKSIGSLKNRLLIENLFLKLLVPNLTQTEIAEILTRLIHRVPKKNLLSQDLTDVWKHLVADISTSRLHGLVVEDTDDPCDLLLIGTDVSTCQDVNKDPKISKCLQAYLLDGKIRAIVVKNELGKIIARCMLRLLWDPYEKRAVLFKERIYTSDEDPLLSKLLREMSKRRAEALGVVLVGDSTMSNMQNGKFNPYPNPLESFKSKAAFEYVDALGGIMSAPYVIEKSMLLYVPVKKA